MSTPEIQPQELSTTLDRYTLIDVRRPDEFNGELSHIPGAKLVTLETELTKTLPTLPKDKDYVFVCRSGGRSGNATEQALALGLKAKNMVGGMIMWNALGLKTEGRK